MKTNRTITSFFLPKGKNGPKDAKKNQLNDDKNINEIEGSNKKQKMSSSLSFGFNANSLSEEVLNVIDTLDKGTGWKEALGKHIESPGFAKLSKFIATERRNHKIFPPPKDTFTALNLLPIENVRVVIVGQDPYHGPNQGHGLAFSVRKGITKPPSLHNIFKELSNDNVASFVTPHHGCLEDWSRQGVLLLNSVLTVRQGQPNSHSKVGWEEFTDQVIRILDNYHSSKGLVFLLWGKYASVKAERVIKRRNHTVICTSHPSPLGASKTKSPFLGSRCFSRANSALIKRGYSPIDWNIGS